MSEELVLVPQKPILPEKNRVWISGKLETDFEFSHKTYLEKFYTATVSITHYNGTADYIGVYVSEQLLSFFPFANYQNKYVEIGGNLRSYALRTANGKKYRRHILFASTLTVYSDEDELEETNSNFIFIDGYLRETPLLRTTRSGQDCTEFWLEVSRKDNVADYIYCQTFSRTALYASQFKAGTRLQIHGSLISKETTKKFTDSSSVTYLDCKVAVHTLRKV